jgi:hypothetical protein
MLTIAAKRLLCGGKRKTSPCSSFHPVSSASSAADAGHRRLDGLREHISTSIACQTMGVQQLPNLTHRPPRRVNI